MKRYIILFIYFLFFSLSYRQEEHMDVKCNKPARLLPACGGPASSQSASNCRNCGNWRATQASVEETYNIAGSNLRTMQKKAFWAKFEFFCTKFWRCSARTKGSIIDGKVEAPHFHSFNRKMEMWKKKWKMTIQWQSSKKKWGKSKKQVQIEGKKSVVPHQHRTCRGDCSMLLC